MKKNLCYLILLVFVSLAACSKNKGVDEVAADSVSLNKSAITIYVGAKDTIVATVSPDNAADKTVTFASDNTSVATVDDKGIVIAIAPGTAAITAETGNGKSATCNVTVEEYNIIRITAPSTAREIEIGLGGSGTVKVEWGDDTSATKTLTEEGEIYTHTYASSSTNFTLKISGGTVIWLYCGYMDFTALDVSKSPALEAIECQYNKLTTLDVSKNTALKYLDCYVNELTTLDVSKNTAMNELWCGINKLTALDVSKNTELIMLDCSNNILTALDVTYNTKLMQISCSENRLTAAALNALYGSMHDKDTPDNRKELYTYGNPGEPTSDKSIAREKGWQVY